MRQLRDALGPDAVILSNRAVEGGRRNLALRGGGHRRDGTAGRATCRPREPESSPAARAARSRVTRIEAGAVAEPVTMQAPPDERGRRAPASDSARAARNSVISEIKSMRDAPGKPARRPGLARPAGPRPVRAAVMRDMLAAGFSAALAREMLEVPADSCDAEQAQAWMRNTLMKRLTRDAERKRHARRAAACSPWWGPPASARPPPPPSWPRAAWCATAPTSWRC